MARQSYKGIQAAVMQLEGLSRGTVKRIVTAGANALVGETKRDIQSRHHVVTGSMQENVRPSKYHETLDSAWQTVYPQGTDARGVSNAMKAFVTNYGRKRAARARPVRGTRKSGDKFITGKRYRDRREKDALEAMQAENEKIIRENGGK